MFLKLFLAQITSASMEFPNHVWMYIPGISLRARALGNHVVVMRAPDWPRSDIWGFPSWIKMALMAKEYGIREGKNWILMPILTNKAWKHISNNWQEPDWIMFASNSVSSKLKPPKYACKWPKYGICQQDVVRCQNKNISIRCM